MIQLDKRIAASVDPGGNVYSWKTQAVLLQNHFFLNPTITYDWKENTCMLNNSVYYLDKVLDKASTLVAIPSEAEWLNTYGNDIKYTYYEGVATGNPSGSTSNLRRSTYIDSLGRTKYIFEYTWDDNNNCVSQKSLAPAGAEASSDIVNYRLRTYSNGQLLTTKMVQEGLTVFLSTPSNPDKDLYSFGGWSGAPEGKLNYIQYYTTYVWAITMGGNYDLTAIWTPIITVNIENEDGEIYATKKVTSGKQLLYSVLDEIIPADTENFDGWYIDGVKVTRATGSTGITLNSTTPKTISVVGKYVAEAETEPDTEPDTSDSETETDAETEGGE